MSRELVIRISPRTVLFTTGLILLILLLIALTQILIAFFVAILLAVTISRPVNWLEEHGVPRGLSIGLIYLILIAALVALGFIVIPLVIHQIELLVQQFPTLVSEPLRQGSEWLGRRFPSLRDSLPTGDLANEVASRGVALLSGVGGFAINLGVRIAGLIIGLVAIMVLAYFLTSQRGFASRTVKMFAPAAYEARLNRLLQVVGRRLGRWVWAQALIAGSYALAFGTGLALLKIPYAVALGVLGGILELVPYIGGLTATALTMIVAFTVDPILALYVLLLHIVIGNIEVHLLAPRLLGRAVETHPVVTILALGAGAELMGIIGAMIALPLVVVLQAIVEEFYLAPRDVLAQGEASVETSPVLSPQAEHETALEDQGASV